jgi:DNA-binding NarL/FixJ family response regulator
MGIRIEPEREAGITYRGIRSSQVLQGGRAWPDFLADQPGRPVRVLLVDDDPHFRRVVVQELVADLRIHLAAQGGSAREGRRLIALHEFDVMMIDLNLGDGSGYELIDCMRSLRPQAEAVVISAMEDEQHALHAFELGATGYLVKKSWFGNYSDAVLQVVNGGASITPSLARRLLHKLDAAQGGAAAIKVANHAGSLSSREREVLTMVARGYTSAEIGHRLAISGQIVNSHVNNIYRKLQVRTRAQAVGLAATAGLLQR